MRLNGQKLHVDRQDIAVGDQIVAFARRDVDRLAAEPQSERGSRRRHVGEVEANRHLKRLALACRLKVQLDDEIAPRFEPPGHAIGRRVRRLAGRPAEHLPFGIASVPDHAADIARFGIARVELTRRACAIDAKIGVMHHASVAGPELDRAHEPRTSDSDRQHEGPEHIAAIGRHGVGLRHLQDDVRFAELPAIVPQRRHLRRMRAIAF